MRHGILPEDGGWLDQDSGLVDLMAYAKQARVERERINNQKTNRRRGKKRFGRR